MRDTLAVTKALADESRLRVLCALHGRELCVCQITALLGLAPSTVSKHMAILHQARLVEARKNGRWIYYRLAAEGAPAAAREALAWVERALRRDPRAREDRTRLKSLLQCKPEDLCRRQTRS